MIIRFVLRLVLALILPLLAMADEAKTIGSAIDATLSWEKRWFGSYFGEQCLRRTAGRRLTGHARTTGHDRTIGFDCRTRAPAKESVAMFDAIVDDLPLFFVGELAPIPRADLTDGEETANCSITDDDLRRRRDSIREGGIRFELTRTNSMPAATPNSQSLAEFVRRTLESFYGGKRQLLPQPLVLGEVRKGDPYLVVAAGQDVHLVAMPSKEQISSSTLCGVVFEARRFAGRDPSGRLSEAAISHLREELGRRGRRLEP